MVNSCILCNKSKTKSSKWIWNSAYIISMLLYNFLVHSKMCFSFLKLVVMVIWAIVCLIILPRHLKSTFYFLIIRQWSDIYQKMRNFKLNKNAIYNFFWEFNSFRVIIKKPFKIKVFFREGRKIDFLEFNQLGPNRWILGY